MTPPPGPDVWPGKSVVRLVRVMSIPPYVSRPSGGPAADFPLYVFDRTRRSPARLTPRRKDRLDLVIGQVRFPGFLSSISSCDVVFETDWQRELPARARGSCGRAENEYARPPFGTDVLREPSCCHGEYGGVGRHPHVFRHFILSAASSFMIKCLQHPNKTKRYFL